MQVNDIVQLNGEANYVVLEMHNNNTPKKIMYLPYWEVHYNNQETINRLAINLDESSPYKWKVISKVNTEEMSHPNYKVIQKIKDMDSKRKEQGYAF